MSSWLSKAPVATGALREAEGSAVETELIQMSVESFDPAPLVGHSPSAQATAGVQSTLGETSIPGGEIRARNGHDANRLATGFPVGGTRPLEGATHPSPLLGRAPIRHRIGAASAATLPTGQPSLAGDPSTAGGQSPAAAARLAVSAVPAFHRPLILAGVRDPNPQLTAAECGVGAEIVDMAESGGAQPTASPMVRPTGEERVAAFGLRDLEGASPEAGPGIAESDTIFPPTGQMRGGRGDAAGLSFQVEAAAPRGNGAHAVPQFAPESTSSAATGSLQQAGDSPGIASGLQGSEPRLTALRETAPVEVSPDSSTVCAVEGEPPLAPGNVSTRRLARTNSRLAENIAAPAAFSGQGVVVDVRAASRKTETFGKKPVEGTQQTVGTDIANVHRTMPATLELPLSMSDATSLARFEFGQVDAATGSAAAASADEFSPAAPVSTQAAVAAVMIAAERLAPGERSAVSLHFAVGEADLLVRVEMRQEQVHATFHTDSAELRAVLTEECRTAAFASAGHTVHFAPAVTSGGTSPEEKAVAAGTGDAFSRSDDGQSHRAPAGEPNLHPPRHRRGDGGTDTAETGGPAQRIQRSTTSVHLHTLA